MDSIFGNNIQGEVWQTFI